MKAIAVVAPYRLDLTVSVLRRLSSNLVDVLTPAGEYLRVLEGVGDSVRLIRVRQIDPENLSVTCEPEVRDPQPTVRLVRRMLGVEVQLTTFYRAAAQVPWLRPLVQSGLGLKPPRYPSLWEACVNAILFQQVSLLAASAIMRRFIASFGQRLEAGGIPVYRFPTLEWFENEGDTTLHAAGVSAGKLGTLRRVSDAIRSGLLDETQLEQQSSVDASSLLRGIKGIGPWTAAVILLRGLGRRDVFPANDTSVAKNLSLIPGSGSINLKAALDILGPERGMLYYHLLLARLRARGDVGRATSAAR